VADAVDEVKERKERGKERTRKGKNEERKERGKERTRKGKNEERKERGKERYRRDRHWVGKGKRDYSG
jgi:hypothetical protein